MVSRTTLSNNITLITHPVAESSSAAVGFYFGVGSRFERDGEHGISHFTEHLLFKGTSSPLHGERTAHDISLAFDALGGFANAYTERDTVCAYCVVPALAGSLEAALGVLCDMAAYCTFPAAELERERAVVQNEIASVLDDAEESALELLAQKVWRGQPIAYPITGTAKDVARLTRGQVAAWYDRHFVHGELTVVAAGRIDESLVARALEALPQHTRRTRHFDAGGAADWCPGTSFVRSRFMQNQVFALFPVSPAVDVRSFYALCVLNALFGDSMASRLFETLREKNGLCYSVYSFFTFYEDTAFWGAASSCDADSLVPLVTKLLGECALLRQNPPSADELERAKSHLCGEELLSCTDMEALMRRHQRNDFLGLPLLETEQVLEGIRAVTAEDVQTLIQSVVDDSRRAVLVYGHGATARRRRRVKPYA